MLIPPSKEDKVKGLIEAGAEIAGGAIGGALGLLGGPPGAIAGGAAGVVAGRALGRVGNEIAERWLAPQERSRLGAVLAIAADDIKQRTDRGEQLRKDGFFEDKPGKMRSNAEQVTENALLKAQREAEEKKIPYIGHMLAGISFDETVSASMAHFLIKQAESLTYSQLILLKIFVVNFQLKGVSQQLGLRVGDFTSNSNLTAGQVEILFACYDLYQRAHITVGGEAQFSPTQLKPDSVRVQGVGALLFNLMELHRIPGEEMNPLITLLK